MKNQGNLNVIKLALYLTNIHEQLLNSGLGHPQNQPIS